MQIPVMLVAACWTAAVGVGVSQAQTAPPPPATTTAPPPAATPPPSALSPSAPASNAAVGTLRRQNRRENLQEQNQRNDAEDALRSRAQTAPRRTAPR